MNNGEFYSPEAVRPLYDQIVPAYQAAFAGEPWFEVSKCADEPVRCEGGFTALGINALCAACGKRPSRPAYQPRELTDRFDQLGASRPTQWYVERNESGDVTLAAIAWNATAATIAAEKYADTPEMSAWMKNTLGDQQITWLDEVFANRTISPTGNLRNFGEMVVGIAERLESPLIAYRTIAPQMTKAPVRAFGDLAQINTRRIDVPDRRDFVTIRPTGEVV